MAGISFEGKVYQSETSKHRALVQPYCTGYGLDLGFGGDPVNDVAIRMDFPQPYAHTGQDLPVQLGGDCRDLKWFRDGVLDFVYSSHVLEDFDEQETEPILREWSRVLRIGGRIVLLLPDQQRYVQYCEARGLDPNPHHSVAHFSLEYVKRVASSIPELECEAEHPEVDEFSFVVVLRKVRPSDAQGDYVGDLHERLEAALRERDALRIETKHQRARLQQLDNSLSRRVARRLGRMLGRNT